MNFFCFETGCIVPFQRKKNPNIPLLGEFRWGGDFGWKSPTRCFDQHITSKPRTSVTSNLDAGVRELSWIFFEKSRDLSRWWQLKEFWTFHPVSLGFHDPIWRYHIFQMGGEKPPTRYCFVFVTFLFFFLFFRLFFLFFSFANFGWWFWWRDPSTKTL